MKNILFLILVFQFLSCGSTTSTTTVDPHTQTHLSKHEAFMAEQQKQALNKELAKKIQGVYIGKIPCADCSGILYRLELFADLMYRTEMTYEGKSSEPVVESGEYTLDKDYLITLSRSRDMKYLKIGNPYLILLDKNGQEITGSLSKMYHLYPEDMKKESSSVEQNPNFLIKKFQEGIDFYASGNEPFWNLDMDFEKNIRFTTMDGVQYNAPAVQPSKVADANIIRYKAVTEAGELIIQIFDRPCDDTMADKKFEYEVRVEFKTSAEKDYKTFTGCGDYVPDFRLHDIYVIREVDGITVNPQDFGKNVPNLEINATEKFVLGHDGCNSFRGSVRFKPGTLVFGPLASTLMACIHNQEISFKIGKALDGELQYKFEDTRLSYYKQDKKVMVLQKVD